MPLRGAGKVTRLNHLEMSKLQKHFVPGYDRTVPPGSLKAQAGPIREGPEGPAQRANPLARRIRRKHLDDRS
jgi:hypothetical protein